MKIKVEIDVFDDPEFCSNNARICKKAHLSLCSGFEDKKGRILSRPYDAKLNKYKKHDQCKAAYQKAEEFENAKGKF